ncbi:mandelate racemase/muconate lactonizing enzyme family protein [Enterocloster asparagiformis]|uniref:mandelate racemase/muconate lactonizing enzyme family protein n=1 Tax=Enterocloster asparagiformis TaxID=333367 RepID=UPI002A82B444|nr:mandelate racemase/muconate lactonizing enzyme family protein [Enterocloster asparagiformis]
MKVREVKIYVVDTGTFRPVIAEVLTDEGINGIGEGAVGFGVGCYAAAKMAEELAGRFVVGKNPDEIQSIWNDFYYDTFWGKGAGAIFYAAASALEHALWDIKGQVLGAPVYQLLGGKQRDQIPVYANGWSEGKCVTPEDFARRAEAVVEKGYDALKMYPMSQVDPVRHLNKHIKNRNVTKANFNCAVKAVELVRRTIGPDRDLLVDVTAEGTSDMMWRFGQAIEPYNIFWYEEAMDAFDVDAYRVIREKVDIPLATGERLYTRYGFRRLLESRAVDIVQPDPGTCGGILEAFHIGAMAETYCARIAPHNCGGPVLTAVAVQLAACLGNLAMQEMFPFHDPCHYEIVEEAFEHKIHDGVLDVPTAPGLGVKLNHSFVDRYLVGDVTEA